MVFQRSLCLCTSAARASNPIRNTTLHGKARHSTMQSRSINNNNQKLHFSQSDTPKDFPRHPYVLSLNAHTNTRRIQPVHEMRFTHKHPAPLRPPPHPDAFTCIDRTRSCDNHTLSKPHAPMNYIFVSSSISSKLKCHWCS